MEREAEKTRAERQMTGKETTNSRAALIPAVEERMIFVIGSPRSGSTLLARMLGAHSAIHGRPEPHLLTPLAHLGYFENVEKAPYDHLQAQESVRAFVADLPNREADYLDACRAYTDVLYGRMLSTSGKKMFLDKTPAYGLILDFISRLYPRAKYVVLTRHPVAVFSSYAESFFDGDFEVALRHNPILARYVPAIARFLRERPAPIIHVLYENLVRDPEREMRAIFRFLGLPFEDGTIEYGGHQLQGKGLGDPTGVNQHSRPVTGSISKWERAMAGRPGEIALVRDMIQGLDPLDVEAWGYSVADIMAALDRCSAAPAAERKGKPLDRYRLERKILVMLRRNIHNNTFGRVVRKVRFYCDVLLR